MSIFIPYNINFLILKHLIYNNNYILIIYNKKNYIILITLTLIFFKKSNTLLINSNNSISLSFANNYLSNFINTWNIFFLKKIKFKGKGYKVVKNKNFLYLIFNHAHLTWFIFFNIICYRLRKQKYIFIYKNFKLLNQIAKNIYNIRPINIFTRRGIRLSKQKIFNKIGKRTS